MSTTLFYSIVFISAALLFYSVAVWTERYSGRLKTWHLSLFWLGLIADASGTELMIREVGHIIFTVHTMTGFIGITLMLLHTIWATIVLIKKNESMIIKFHRLSMFVWIVWLISYLSGAVMGMNAIN